MVSVVYHKDGTPQCSQCNTGYEDAEQAEYCCTSCVNCGFRQHGMHDRAAECCPCSCDSDGCFCDENGDCCQNYLKDYSAETDDYSIYLKVWLDNDNYDSPLFGVFDTEKKAKAARWHDRNDNVRVFDIIKISRKGGKAVFGSEWHHANTVCPECNSDDVDYTKVYYCSQCGEDDLVPGEQCSCDNIVGSKDYFEQMICGDCDAAWIEDDYSAEEDEYIRCDWCNNGIGTLEELESGSVEYLGKGPDIVCMTCVTKRGIAYDVSHAESGDSWIVKVSSDHGGFDMESFVQEFDALNQFKSWVTDLKGNPSNLHIHRGDFRVWLNEVNGDTVQIYHGHPEDTNLGTDTFEAPRKTVSVSRRKKNKKISKTISDIMHSWEKTGKIGKNRPKSRKSAQKMAIAVAYSINNKKAETFGAEGGKSCSDCGRGIDKRTHMEFEGMCGDCYGAWNVCQNCGMDTDYYIHGKGFVLCEKCYGYKNAESNFKGGCMHCGQPLEEVEIWEDFRCPLCSKSIGDIYQSIADYEEIFDAESNFKGKIIWDWEAQIEVNPDDWQDISKNLLNSATLDEIERHCIGFVEDSIPELFLKDSLTDELFVYTQQYGEMLVNISMEIDYDGLSLSSEEGNTPIMPPMDFGEMAKWRPLDGTPGLKRNRAEDFEMVECGDCDATFSIDEGLDIGGIDYCEECYDTRMSKEES